MKYLPSQKKYFVQNVTNSKTRQETSSILVSVYFCEAFLMVISPGIYRFHRSLSCFIVVLTAIAALGKLSSLNLINWKLIT